jgi:hypothetical protein
MRLQLALRRSCPCAHRPMPSHAWNRATRPEASIVSNLTMPYFVPFHFVLPIHHPAFSFALTPPGRRSRGAATPVGKKRTRTPWQKLFQSRNRVASGSNSLLDHIVIPSLCHQLFDIGLSLPLFEQTRTSKDGHRYRTTTIRFAPDLQPL